MSEPRIAAVIPVYNGAHFLRKAVESVLQQTSPVDELVVLDDGSTDSTREVALSYGDRVHYVYQPNRGLPAARNAGARAASCEWVAFLDCDDWWLPNKMERQRELLRANPDAILLYADQWECDPAGAMTYSSAIPPARLWPQLRTRNGMSSSVVMMRRDALFAVGGYNQSLNACEDWDLYTRLYPCGRFAYQPEPLAVYRVAPGTMSTDSDRMLRNFEAILEPVLLMGLRGPSRWAWRRRARAAQLFAAGLIERDAGNNHRALRFMLRSLLAWPTPTRDRRRYAATLVTLSRAIRKTGSTTTQARHAEDSVSKEGPVIVS